MSTFLIILLVISKFFYVSLFSVGSFNFTLSDVCLVLCLFQIVTSPSNTFKRDESVLAALRSMVILACAVAALNCFSTLVMDTSMVSTVMNLIKRWLSMLIIPIYLYRCVASDQRRKIIVWIMVVVVVYAILNFGNITSGDTERFMGDGSANPNVLAGVFGMLLMHLIYGEYKRWIKIALMVLSALLMLACASRGGILAVLLAFGYWLWTNKELNLSQKGRIVLGSIVLVAVCLPIGNQLFPAATQRIIDSFTGGLQETSSYQMRTATFGDLMKIMLGDALLLFFGSGFGNGNLTLTMARQGTVIATADNMFANLFGWCGAVAVPFLLIYFLRVWKMGEQAKKIASPALALLTVYMFALGFSQDAMFEPTVGCLYFVFFGLELIYYADCVAEQQNAETVRKESAEK